MAPIPTSTESLTGSAMSISTLHFPAAPLLPPRRTAQQPVYVFKAMTDLPSSETLTVTTVDECIVDRGMRRVYRVTATLNTSGESRRLVCKVAFGRRWFKILREEALLYEGQLKPLCGEAVPNYHGFFRGETFEGKTGIMVLEDCGTRNSVPLDRQPLYFRKAVAQAVLALHRTGVRFYVWHTDEHIVIHYDPRKEKHVPEVVGFSSSQVKTAHECLCTYEVVEYGPEPEYAEVICKDLWMLLLEVDIFSRGVYTSVGPTLYRLLTSRPAEHVKIFNVPVPAEYTGDLGLLREYIGIPPLSIPDEGLSRMAATLVRKHKKWLEERQEVDNGPVQLDTAPSAACSALSAIRFRVRIYEYLLSITVRVSNVCGSQCRAWWITNYGILQHVQPTQEQRDGRIERQTGSEQAKRRGTEKHERGS
ncbi:hypothetical protein NUW54_g10240 [Trametes sanguinea]|uniref:Uncharacterized protein n=1 Tax=Trametes sanguinea TaxID=158606 RepID=A0ACC1P1R5_9APHY|nr:hypothetical protein NUW54_g10240 [Trametes sanguinea]